MSGKRMSKLPSFVILAFGLLFFPGVAPATEAGPIAASCARRDLQALREAQEEITVRDIAAASGIKETKLRQLLKTNGQGRGDEAQGVGEALRQAACGPSLGGPRASPAP